MRYLLWTLFLLIQTAFQAQQLPPAGYPKSYFRYPLNIPIRLSGNFGELRSNHYHMGIDLKTNARENYPVYAAADGYIARIKIEPGGFGRAIYINHPNGFTTVYVHLNSFNSSLENWLKKQQYQLESWKVFLNLSPDLFPVKKGEFIAYSGNTGGSQAPHLHFEIRRTEDDVNLNPLLFGFGIADNLSPRLVRIGIYDRTRSIYELSPRLFPVKKTGDVYTVSTGAIAVSSPKISFAISTFDMVDGSSNHYGIFESMLFMDDKPVISFQLDNISYNDTRCVNAHIDYKTRVGGGPYLQHLSELPGYINSIYKQISGNGVIDLSDGAAHAVKILVKDASGNESILQFKVKWNGYQNPDPKPPTANEKLFYPLMLDVFEADECEFYIGERCLYDSVHIIYNKLPVAEQSVSALHSIGPNYIPLQDSFLIRIKPIRSLSAAEKSRTVMQWYAGSKKDIQKTDWQNEWASARFRDFGFYHLLIDDEPPVIVPIGFADGSNLKKSSRIVFVVKDNLEKIKNVRVKLDGKWLRFTNDKGRTFIYRFDEKCLAGEHELKITAEDEAGNVTENTFKFSR